MRARSCRTGVCFFFFQAEDGIRDLTVTGVQTCALPICQASIVLRRRRQVRHEGEIVAWSNRGQESVELGGRDGGRWGLRSEERRVGKSVDLGGRRIIKKKKRTDLRMLIKNMYSGQVVYM